MLFLDQTKCSSTSCASVLERPSLQNQKATDGLAQQMAVGLAPALLYCRRPELCRHMPPLLQGHLIWEHPLTSLGLVIFSPPPLFLQALALANSFVRAAYPWSVAVLNYHHQDTLLLELWPFPPTIFLTVSSYAILSFRGTGFLLYTHCFPLPSTTCNCSKVKAQCLHHLVRLVQTEQ